MLQHRLQTQKGKGVKPELPCGHVGVGLSDEDACEPKHGNAAVPVLSPGSSSSSSSGSGRGSTSEHTDSAYCWPGIWQCANLCWWRVRTLHAGAVRTGGVGSARTLFKHAACQQIGSRSLVGATNAKVALCARVIGEVAPQLMAY